MDRVISKPITIQMKEHYFECDLCGKYLGKTIEHEDGFFYTLGDYEHRVLIDGKRYELKKTLCTDCQKIIISKIVIALKDIGFEEK